MSCKVCGGSGVIMPHHREKDRPTPCPSCSIQNKGKGVGSITAEMGCFGVMLFVIFPVLMSIVGPFYFLPYVLEYFYISNSFLNFLVLFSVFSFLGGYYILFVISFRYSVFFPILMGLAWVIILSSIEGRF